MRLGATSMPHNLIVLGLGNDGSKHTPWGKQAAAHSAGAVLALSALNLSQPSLALCLLPLLPDADVSPDSPAAEGSQAVFQSDEDEDGTGVCRCRCL
jgi:hypothetical protein